MPTAAITAAATLLAGSSECEVRLAVNSTLIVVSVVLGFAAFAAMAWAGIRSGRE